jgi:hypothetical protein
MTDIKRVVFDSSADLTVYFRDGHVFPSVAAIDFQDHGLMFDETETGDHMRIFAPWSFVQSVTQNLG